MKKSNIYTVAMIYILMMLIGVIENVKGPLMPIIKTYYHVNYMSMGMFLSAGSAGYILSTFIGGFIAEKFGHKFLLSIGLTLIILGILSFIFCSDFIVFLIMVFVMYLGVGSLEIGLNTAASLVFVANQALMMNLLHFFYGFGATVTPGITGNFIRNNFTWQNIYIMVACLTAVLFVILMFVKFPREKYRNVKIRESYLKIIGKKSILLLAVIISFYVASEMGVGSWLVTFLKGAYNLTYAQSSYYLSLFFGTYTVGRLLGGFIVERIGYIKSLITFSFASVLFIFLGMAGKNFILFLSLAGFFYSIIFPTVMAVVMKCYKEHTSLIMSFIITMSSVVNLFVNVFIGKTNDMLGVYFGFATIPVFMAVVLISLAFQRSFLKQNNL